MARNKFTQAIDAFEIAHNLENETIAPLVNQGMAYSYLGDNYNAEKSLKKAVQVEPKNAIANMNLGLLLGEKGDFEEAKLALRRALEGDPLMGSAAYNLAVMLSRDSLKEAINFAKTAWESSQDPRYGYSYAYFLLQSKNSNLAETVLKSVIIQSPLYNQAYLLLEDIYVKNNSGVLAVKLYREGLRNESLPEDIKKFFRYRINILESVN